MLQGLAARQSCCLIHIEQLGNEIFGTGTYRSELWVVEMKLAELNGLVDLDLVLAMKG